MTSNAHQQQQTSQHHNCPLEAAAHPISGLAGLDLGGLSTLADTYTTNVQDDDEEQEEGLLEAVGDHVEGDLVIADLEEDGDEDFYFDQGEQDMEDNLEAMANSLHVTTTTTNESNSDQESGDCFGSTGLFTAM